MPIQDDGQRFGPAVIRLRLAPVPETMRPKATPSAMAFTLSSVLSTREGMRTGTRAPTTTWAHCEYPRYFTALPSKFPASMFGTTRQSAFPATSLLMPFARAALRDQSVVQRQRPIEHRPAEFSALRHANQRQRIHRGGNSLGDRFGGAHHGDTGPRDPDRIHVDGVQYDLPLLVRVGRTFSPPSVMAARRVSPDNTSS